MLTQVLFWCLFPLLLRNSWNKQQNNCLVIILWVNFWVWWPPTCNPVFQAQNPTEFQPGWNRTLIISLTNFFNINCYEQWTVNKSHWSWAYSKVFIHFANHYKKFRWKQSRQVAGAHQLLSSHLSGYISITRSRTSQTSGASRDFGVGPEFGTMRKQPIIPRNLWACSCASAEVRVTWLNLRPG